jgi:hypothetical protein
MGHDNVIIFGAGASADAGIPLLASFLKTMQQYILREKAGDRAISPDNLELLKRANQIRVGLERYNSRAYFDNLNIEDILSLLSFEALQGPQEAAKFETMVKAVSATIELSCLHSHTSAAPDKLFPNSHYTGFWDAILHPQNRDALPALITFNYDLVLERTLWKSFHIQGQPHSWTDSLESVGIKYEFGDYDFVIARASHRYKGVDTMLPLGECGIRSWGGTSTITIPYFKLHGSLNWSSKELSYMPNVGDDRREPLSSPTEAVEAPLILPPVFNKKDSSKLDKVWSSALRVLREAKNIIIVGYSLPKTDIYMQYFLKSAVGPNSNLQKIIVFDPILFEESDRMRAMKLRYQECFAPQFLGQIEFNPNVGPEHKIGSIYGTFAHFVYMLKNRPETLLF